METPKKVTKRLLNFFLLTQEKLNFMMNLGPMNFVNTRKLKEQRKIQKEMLLEQSTSF